MTQQLTIGFDECPPSPITVADIFQAYYECRRHKRKTANAMKFTGAFILPNRIYIDKRAKKNFCTAIDRANRRMGVCRNSNHATIIHTPVLPLTPTERDHILASFNSYLGYMVHYKTFNLRKRILRKLSARIESYMRPAKRYAKLKKIS